MNLNLLTTVKLYNNPHYVSRYLAFILARVGNPRVKYQTHYHHILPKAADFFPEFKSLRDHPWNGVHLSAREHFIAHRMLHKAFPGSSQSIAFFNMANICGKTHSRAYNDARQHQIDSLAKLHSSPERNAKISASLSGRPKTSEHIAKLVGHEVTASTRQKLREANLGKKASAEAKQKMSATRTGKKRGPCSDEAKANISAALKERKLRWFNNGTESRTFAAAPDSSWAPGRLRSPTQGLKWFNNGVESKMLVEPPDNTWSRGRL
jgi:hypothetical protein